jgi:hydroxymethylpyrimidine pyrophosphatase-like HAD family hydrolase
METTLGTKLSAFFRRVRQGGAPQDTRPKALALDVDQCLLWTEFDKPIPKRYWEALGELGLLFAQLQNQGVKVCLNTGRDRNYAEALCFALQIKDWCIVEGGRKLFHPVLKTERNHPGVSPDAIKAILRLQHSWVPEIQKRHPEILLYPGKTTMVTLEVQHHNAQMSLEDYTAIIMADPVIQELVEQELIVVERSQIAVDIGAAGRNGPINKGSGLVSLAREIGIHPSEMLAMDDSMSGGSAFQLAGFVACPANATGECQRLVREREGFIASQAGPAGVLQAIKHFCS